MDGRIDSLNLLTDLPKSSPKKIKKRNPFSNKKGENRERERERERDEIPFQEKVTESLSYLQ